MEFTKNAFNSKVYFEEDFFFCHCLHICLFFINILKKTEMHYTNIKSNRY